MGAMLCIFALISICAPVKAQQDAEPEQLIFAVSYKPYILSNGILAAQKGDSFYLPLVQLSELFDFYLEDDSAHGAIHGFYLDEKNSFAIDLEGGTYEVKGEKKTLAPGTVLKDPFNEGAGELYAKLEFLNELWPVKLEVDLSMLVLSVTSEQKLAFQLRAEREERRKMAEARQKLREQQEKVLPFISNPYKLIGKPVLDYETRYSWSGNRHQKKISASSALNGVQDIAGTSAEYGATFVADQGDSHKLSDVRLRFKRQALGDEKFPLGARQIQAGDVRLTQRDQIGGGTNGRGVIVSTSGADISNEFDLITIQGTGLPGWEVEVYRNDVLIDFGVIDEKGEYRFEDVALEVGNNQIRTVLYGPQGQIEEVAENYSIAGGMLKPGEVSYTGGIVDNGRDLILVDEGPMNDPKGRIATISAARGINKSLTIFGTLTHLPMRDGQEDVERRYAAVGATGAFLNSLAQVELYKDISGGGTAIDARFATKIFGLRVNLRAAGFKVYESPSAGFGSNAKKYEGRANVSTNMDTFLGKLSLRLDAQHTALRSGLAVSDIATSQTVGSRGLQVTNRTSTTLADFIHTNSNGALNATVRVKKIQLRSQLSYNLFPEKEFSSLGGEIRYRGQDGFTAAVNAQHSFLTRATGTGLQLAYDFGRVLGSFDMGWERDHGFGFSINASTSLAPYGPNGQYILSSQSRSDIAPVQSRVFLDADSNGVFNEGDEPLPDTRLLVGGRTSNAESDKDGVVVAESSFTGKRENISINKDSLSNPYYVPEIEGFSTVLRQGSMPIFDLPVIETGSIDGTITSTSDGRPVQGITIQLVNKEGAVVTTTESAYDGYYTFEYVPPGTYTVRVDPSYQVNVPPETVTVANEDLYPSGIDLQLEQAAKAEAAVDETAAESGGVAQTHHESSNGTVQPAPLPTDKGGPAFVNRVRIGEYKDKVRLVLYLSGPIEYSVTESEEGTTISIDMPDVDWDAERHWRSAHTPVIQSYDTQALDGGGTRLIIKAKATMRIGDKGIFGPYKGQGYLYYFDLYPR